MCSHSDPLCQTHLVEVGEILLMGKSSMLHSSPKPLSFSIFVAPSPGQQRWMDREAWVGRVGVGQNSPPPHPFSSCPSLGLASSLWVSLPLGSQSHCLTPGARLCKEVREFSTRHSGLAHKTEALGTQALPCLEVTFFFYSFLIFF